LEKQGGVSVWDARLTITEPQAGTLRKSRTH